MSGFMNKVNVAVGSEKRRSFDLSCSHLQSASPFQFNVAYCRELMPGSDIKLNHRTFVRTTPLLKPTLGSFQFHNRAFFVPFRCVWEPFSDFVTDVPHATQEGTMFLQTVPTLSAAVIQEVFTTIRYGYAELVVPEDPNYDVYDFELSATRYRYTAFGRLAMKLLNSLGYHALYGDDKTSFSALPFLCVCKVFIDWYYPSQYAHRGAYAVIDGIFQRHYTYSLSVSDFNDCLAAVLFVYYDSDYFTAAWDSPVAAGGQGALSTTSNNFEIVDITFDRVGSGSSVRNVPGVVSNDPAANVANGTPVFGRTASAGYAGLTQYMDDALHALTDYIKRHQLVGSRAMDRYLARYGLQLQADKLRRSYYVGSDDFPLQIGEVMSNAATTDAAIGEYAGRSVAYSGDCNFEFATDEFGYFFVVNTCIPDVDYVQGVDRNVMHVSKLDFFTPEFDGLGVQAIASAEVAVANTDGGYNAEAMSQIFGFTGRYAEYKVGVSRQTGDFSYPSVNGGLLPWSTARLFDVDTLPTAVGMVHSLEFCAGRSDHSQYNRVFYGFEDGQLVDNLYLIHRSNVKITMPARSLFDTYEFDTETDRKVTVDANGVKLN